MDTRLRKAFPAASDDNEDDGLDEPLDEEHQEKLIAELAAKDKQRNDLYRTGYTMIPLLAGAFFLYTTIVASTPRQRWVNLLSTSSVFCSAYIIQFMPIEAPQRKGKRPVYQVEADKGPVESYLAYLNAVLAGLLLVMAWLSWRNGQIKQAWREGLPEIIFCLSMFVRDQLAPIDLEELQKAKYDYKGA